MSQEIQKLDLFVLNENIIIQQSEQSIKLRLKAFNRSKDKLKLYCFYNEWGDSCPVEWLPDYAHLGFNVVIFNRKDKMQYPNSEIADTEQDLLEIWNKGSISLDSAQAVLDRRYGKDRNWEANIRKEIIASGVLVSSGDSVATELDINLSNYDLPKGEYNLVIYYVINKKIFEYIRTSKELFWGYVRSNKVPLIVK